MAGWGSAANGARGFRRVRDEVIQLSQRYGVVRDAMLALRGNHVSPAARIAQIEARLDALEEPQ